MFSDCEGTGQSFSFSLQVLVFASDVDLSLQALVFSLGVISRMLSYSHALHFGECGIHIGVGSVLCHSFHLIIVGFACGKSFVLEGKLLGGSDAEIFTFLLGGTVNLILGSSAYFFS